MGTQEIQSNSKTGNIVLSVEMRKSIEGAEKCKAFFDELKLIDWLNSVNEHYLSGNAKIDGPNYRIASGIPASNADAEGDVKLFELELSWGGIKTELKWDCNNSGSQSVITVWLVYSDDNDVFQLHLEGERPSSNADQSKMSFFRVFLLNPGYIRMGDIDDALLTFTGELVDCGIL